MRINLPDHWRIEVLDFINSIELIRDGDLLSYDFLWCDGEWFSIDGWGGRRPVPQFARATTRDEAVSVAIHEAHRFLHLLNQEYNDES